MDVAIPTLSELILALAVGAALGVWFFGGLLWTVRRVTTGGRPVPLMLMSFAVRSAGVVVGLGWLVGRHWLLPAAAMVAFVAVRMCILKSWGHPRVTRVPE